MKLLKSEYLTMQLIADRLGCERTAEKICAAISKLQNDATLARIEVSQFRAAGVELVESVDR